MSTFYPTLHTPNSLIESPPHARGTDSDQAAIAVLDIFADKKLKIFTDLYSLISNVLEKPVRTLVDGQILLLFRHRDRFLEYFRTFDAQSPLIDQPRSQACFATFIGLRQAYNSCFRNEGTCRPHEANPSSYVATIRRFFGAGVPQIGHSDFSLAASEMKYLPPHEANPIKLPSRPSADSSEAGVPQIGHSDFFVSCFRNEVPAARTRRIHQATVATI